MGKPYPNKNGFTLVEMLVVLLIVSMLGFGLSTKMHSSLYVFMKNLQTLADSMYYGAGKSVCKTSKSVC